MAINFNADSPSVPRSIYILFITLQAVTLLIVYFGLVDPSKVRRNDGTSLARYPHTDIWTELKAQGELFRDWKAMVLFIPIFSSEIAIIIISTCNGKVLAWRRSVSILTSIYFYSTVLQSKDSIAELCPFHRHADGWSIGHDAPPRQSENWNQAESRSHWNHCHGHSHHGRLGGFCRYVVPSIDH